MTHSSTALTGWSIAGWRRRKRRAQNTAVMFEFEYLTAQARKCRTLASGLSNREDVRKLEELARELEERARLAELAAQPVGHAITL